MRQLLILLSLFMTTSNVWAFQDARVIAQINQLEAQSPSLSKGERLASFQQLKDLLINEMEALVPRQPQVPENATEAQIEAISKLPAVKEYSSLNEFSFYLDDIDLSVVNRVTCASAQSTVEGATNVDPDEMSAETCQALRVIKAMGCVLEGPTPKSCK